MSTECRFDRALTRDIPAQVLEQLRTDTATQGRTDAQTASYLARQLEQVEAEVMEDPRAELPIMAGGVIPIMSDVDPGAKSFGYYNMTGLGIAEFMAGCAGKDMPMVSRSARETFQNTAIFGLGYQLCREDLRNGAFANRDPIREHADQAEHGHRQAHETVAAWGDDAEGFKGFYNHPNVPEIAPLADGGALTSWITKDPTFIAADVAAMKAVVRSNTVGLRRINAILLPDDVFEHISGRVFATAAGVNPSETVLSFLRKVHPDISFGSVLALQPEFSEGHLAAGEGTAIGYIAGNSKIVNYKRIMDATFYEPQWEGLTMKVPGESKTGGVQYKEPLTGVRLVGID